MDKDDSPNIPFKSRSLKSKTLYILLRVVAPIALAVVLCLFIAFDPRG